MGEIASFPIHPTESQELGIRHFIWLVLRQNIEKENICLDDSKLKEASTIHFKFNHQYTMRVSYTHSFILHLNIELYSTQANIFFHSCNAQKA